MNLKMFVFGAFLHTYRFVVLEVIPEDEFSQLNKSLGTGADNPESLPLRLGAHTSI
jgi:hypothetical protein